MSRTQCVKVSHLRKDYDDPDMNLEKWCAGPHNVLCCRRGRIFIHDKKTKTKRIYHYPQSKWHNPYKVTDEVPLKRSLRLYYKHLKKTGLVDQIHELRGKVLGCFCDQSGLCHVQILEELVRRLEKKR